MGEEIAKVSLIEVVQNLQCERLEVRIYRVLLVQVEDDVNLADGQAVPELNGTFALKYVCRRRRRSKGRKTWVVFFLSTRLPFKVCAKCGVF